MYKMRSDLFKFTTLLAIVDQQVGSEKGERRGHGKINRCGVCESAYEPFAEVHSSVHVSAFITYGLIQSGNNCHFSNAVQL